MHAFYNSFFLFHVRSLKVLKDAWTLAIETYSWIELRRLNERLALDRTARQLGIEDAKAIRLAHKLVYETIRRQNFIDYFINSLLKPRQLDDLKLGPKAFLRLYTYATKWLKQDFEKAVNIAQMGHSILGWHSLQEIEEVLGQILAADLPTLLYSITDEEKTALLTYHPSWFVKYCFKFFGRREALAFLENSANVKSTYVRINTLKTSEETAVKKLENEGVFLEEDEKLKHVYKVLKSQHPLTRTKSFSQGLFFIQDRASCLATEIANPQSDMTVLDICAAPGAKTTHLTQLMENKGIIYSIDYSQRRMKIWEKEIKRMGAEIAMPIVADARKPLPINVTADLIVLDPPCTGTGTFTGTPSAKWRLAEKSAENMARVQWEILNQCKEYVKNGGSIVYSTCSITLEENEMIIEKFLKWHPEFTLVETLPKIGLTGFRGQTKCQRLYPHLHDCNGFFVAKLLLKS
jgi:16S rRNA (cytosine967-C5)-methyltransferase